MLHDEFTRWLISVGIAYLIGVINGGIAVKYLLCPVCLA